MDKSSPPLSDVEARKEMSPLCILSDDKAGNAFGHECPGLKNK